MKKWDADQPDPAPIPGQRNMDVIESGRDGPPRQPWQIAIVVVLIVAAAATGYLFGSRNRATPVTSSATVAVADPLLATGKRCSVQVKDRLQLGIEVMNQSVTTLTLRTVTPVLPLHGLRATATTWGSCGQLSPTAEGDYPVPAGATAWLTIIFDVEVRCPSPIPVLFTVDYAQGSRSGTADLPGFPDLGSVPYSRCTTGD
jgi:hypothetical protein